MLGVLERITINIRVELLVAGRVSVQIWEASWNVSLVVKRIIAFACSVEGSIPSRSE